jgi:peptidoglycan/xylan/chitin deacetylase (PgdA/CDA1 family)
MNKQEDDMKKLSIILACVSLLAFSGCTAQESSEEPQTQVTVEQTTVTEEDTQEVKSENEDNTQGEVQEEATPAEAPEETEAEEAVVEEETAPEVQAIDLETVKPNETGEVMVVMYHSLGEKNSAYIRTIDSFKADLERLYAMGFRTLSLEDYVNNNITTPAGYTPVVLTFDDGHYTNFNILEENGEMVIDPNSVVGIMNDFYDAHPDFGKEATFFLNGGTPFKQKEYLDYKLNYLLENGMDIGNHSTGHEHLPQLTAAQIQKTLGGNIQDIEAIVPEYKVKALALPFGERPKDEYLNGLVTTGEYNGVKYSHNAILKVGWKPEVAAIHKKFDFERINRVQSGDGEYQMTFYLDNYEKNPSKRFISDGDPMIVTVPESRVDTVDQTRLGQMELRTY